MTVSHWHELLDKEEASHRDVVIGAGIVGSYAATALSSRGRDVALVDSGTAASGASGRNGGFVLTAQRDPYPMLVERSGRAIARDILGAVRTNVARMQSLAKKHGVEVGPTPCRLAESAADLRELQRWGRLLEEDGVQVDLQNTDPYGSGYLAHMRIEGDFVTQPAELTTKLAKASGATRYDHNEVYAIERSGAEWIVRGRRVNIRCERVFICTNGYAGAIDSFLRAHVAPKRGQMFVTATSDFTLPFAGIGHGGYFRPGQDGRVIIGGARAYFMEQESTSEDAVTGNLQERLVGYLKRWLPAVPPEPVRSWSGIQGFTSDRRCIVGTHPQHDTLAFAVGFSGYGNGIGLVAAERMIDHALDGTSPGAFGLSRETLTPLTTRVMT